MPSEFLKQKKKGKERVKKLRPNPTLFVNKGTKQYGKRGQMLQLSAFDKMIKKGVKGGRETNSPWATIPAQSSCVAFGEMKKYLIPEWQGENWGRTLRLERNLFFRSGSRARLDSGTVHHSFLKTVLLIASRNANAKTQREPTNYKNTVFLIASAVGKEKGSPSGIPC